MFNTRTARRCLPCLDPARREGEVEEDSIQQQHNGVVVMEERGSPAGLRQAPTGEEEVSREGGRRQGFKCCCPSLPSLYIGARERGEAQPCPLLQERGAAKRGGRSPSSPRHLGGAFPFEDSSLPKFPWRMGLLGLVPLAHIGQGAPPTAHVAPGAGGPTRWAPGTLPVVPVQYR